MANKVHVKKGDLVLVLSGKDRGKRGKVLGVVADKGVVIVEGVNMVKRHTRPRNRYQAGGILKQEAPIDSSNVMLLCGKCDNPTKIGKMNLENGEKVRVCKKCNEVIDTVKVVANN